MTPSCINFRFFFCNSFLNFLYSGLCKNHFILVLTLVSDLNGQNYRLRWGERVPSIIWTEIIIWVRQVGCGCVPRMVTSSSGPDWVWGRMEMLWCRSRSSLGAAEPHLAKEGAKGRAKGRAPGSQRPHSASAAACWFSSPASPEMGLLRMAGHCYL